MIKTMKKLAALTILAIVGCEPWSGPRMEAEEFPMIVGAVHIYRLEGFETGDSMVVTTIGTRSHEKRTVYIDSIAYFEDDSLKRSSEAYYALTSSYLYYYGDDAIGYLDDPIPLISFSLYQGKLWYEDSEDTLGPYWECIDYDTLWLEPGRYRAFCVEPGRSSESGITRYWYAPEVGLVKYGQSSLTGTSRNQEIVTYYPDGIPEDSAGFLQ